MRPITGSKTALSRSRTDAVRRSCCVIDRCTKFQRCAWRMSRVESPAGRFAVTSGVRDRRLRSDDGVGAAAAPICDRILASHSLIHRPRRCEFLPRCARAERAIPRRIHCWRGLKKEARWSLTGPHRALGLTDTGLKARPGRIRQSKWGPPWTVDEKLATMAALAGTRHLRLLAGTDRLPPFCTLEALWLRPPR